MQVSPGASAPERRQLVTGTYNLRDTGGYRAAGGTTRWGSLYRSDALHRLDDGARAALRALGIRQVIDLRDPAELESAPSRLDGLDVVVHHTPVFDGADPAQMMRPGITLAAVYHRMIEDHGTNLVRAVSLIARAGDEAVLVHCTAGKDRTGVVVALALLAAGVDRSDVVADYAASERHLAGEWADGMRARVSSYGAELTPEIDELLAASPSALLEEILDRIDAQHGSAVGYLLDRGLDPADLDLLRARLVDRDAAA